ncbi:helix-turn-helix domain-containing protein [Streptomyces sp. ITFR-16]|uniref:IclR family transcriptional regulator n=1 Tax=Streptomyces sp. ITFR-16 TaxID=3075198 RepID=UPI00288A45ED|nr:helix-turn-helix domain-containing protein [Streptomyces sp. ITFR-16]WNI23648.1 helix-turn-helix domain-containing protein [Streptomyces sp. ITFR-16]
MTTASSPAVPTLIGSVQRALRLLEAVGTHRDGAPAKQLAREAGLPLPTAYHLLRTLTHEGYLRRENGVFLFGDAAERLAGDGGVRNRPRTMAQSLGRWRDIVGAPVYCAVYRDGEIELVAVADTPAAPAVAEWAAFRETGHAHAIGQCLLSRLDEKAREDHLDRHPVRPLTRYSVRDRPALLERLRSLERTEPVIERQEYALGTVCAAIPITAGFPAAAMAISVPLDQEERLLPAVERLRGEVASLLRSFVFSISI